MATETELSAAIQWFSREDGVVDIWDHPNFKSNIVLPDNYRPITRVEEGLELIKQGKLTKDMMIILKVIGDAICANENQIRRYLSKKMSYSETSKHITYFRKMGLVERHQCRLAFIEEEGDEVIRPPNPLTLGVGGYKLLNHYYGNEKFFTPDYWQQNSIAVQRYVALNELRCLAVESGNIRGWVWHPFIGGNTKLNKPSAAMRLETDNGEIQFIIEYAQMSQNFIGYLKKRLDELGRIHERDKQIIIDGFEKTPKQVVLISVSSVEMARFIQKHLRIELYQYDIWFVVAEWYDADSGLETAIGMVSEDGISRKRIGMLRKKEN